MRKIEKVRRPPRPAQRVARFFAQPAKILSRFVELSK